MGVFTVCHTVFDFLILCVFASIFDPNPSNMDGPYEYLEDSIKYQRLLFSPLKKKGFIPEQGAEVFVRQIPPQETERDLLEFFQTVGTVFQVRLMMDQNNKNNRGFGYITFFDASSAKMAVGTLNSAEYKDGRFLVVENSLNNCRLFIGGIPTYKRKDQVWQELYCKGIKNIIDVIMYRSYSDRAENRGFVFVEFRTHEEAAHFRAKYGKSLKLWDIPVVVDWSIPMPLVDDAIMDTVKIIYLRNLDVCDTREDIQAVALNYTSRHTIEKVYKFKNYAFIHLATREYAERLLKNLKDYYKGTIVEVTWAKPPNRFTSQDYRHNQVSYLSSKSVPKRSPRRSSTTCLYCQRALADDSSQSSTTPNVSDIVSQTSSSETIPELPTPNISWNEPSTSVGPYESFCRDLGWTTRSIISSPIEEDTLRVYQSDMANIFGEGIAPNPQDAVCSVVSDDFSILPSFVPYYSVHEDFIRDLLD